MSERFDRRRRFVAAIFLSALFGMSRFSVRELFAALVMVLRSVIAAVFGTGRASVELKEERLAICRECPIYFKPLGTCGSPLAENPNLGCWCDMNRKSKIKAATCWIRQNTDLDTGWIR